VKLYPDLNFSIYLRINHSAKAEQNHYWFYVACYLRKKSIKIQTLLVTTMHMHAQHNCKFAKGIKTLKENFVPYS